MTAVMSLQLHDWMKDERILAKAKVIRPYQTMIGKVWISPEIICAGNCQKNQEQMFDFFFI